MKLVYAAYGHFHSLQDSQVSCNLDVRLPPKGHWDILQDIVIIFTGLGYSNIQRRPATIINFPSVVGDTPFSTAGVNCAMHTVLCWPERLDTLALCLVSKAPIRIMI